VETIFAGVSSFHIDGQSANARCCAKTPRVGCVEVPDVSRAEDVGLPIRGGVQDWIIGGIG